MISGLFQVLQDVVPEHFPYSDTGCEISQFCLRCPLPQCKYDDPGGLHRERRKKRDQEVLSRLQEDRLSVSEAASHFALSQRTIFRILKRSRRVATLSF
jgi:hypothetical protein